MNESLKSEWTLCPTGKRKTRLKLREDTAFENFPLFCPKCKQEALISIKHMRITVIKEPDAQAQSR
ncbi:MAG: cysteine-rich KTR domain-containing protein [Ruthenibacterium sp.]